jgi:hypothetical protein
MTSCSRKLSGPGVTEALQEYIQRRQQARITELFGTIEFDPSYDYKEQRRRR